MSHLCGEASPRLCCRKPFPDAFLGGMDSFVMLCKAPKLSELGKESVAEAKF